MITARNSLGIGLLLVAAAGSWYLASALHTKAPPPASPGALQTGFYLKAARVLGTDENGKLMYEIEAEYAEQQADDGIEFSNVRVRYSAEASVPWLISADKAIISANQEHLTLSGHVLATSAEGVSGQATEIRTEWLELEPANFKAETDRRVQIRVGSRSVTATGMLALLKESRLELKSNVSGKFVP